MASLNRFPVFGLFAARAALKLGYADDEAKMLGYGTALLYAIFKQGAGRGKGASKEPNPTKAGPGERETLPFGGQRFEIVRSKGPAKQHGKFGRGGNIEKIIVGGETHGPDKFDSQVAAKFPPSYVTHLCGAFDAYLATCTNPTIEHSLFSLYQNFRDAPEVKLPGRFPRMDLDELIKWCRARAKRAA